MSSALVRLPRVLTDERVLTALDIQNQEFDLKRPHLIKIFAVAMFASLTLSASSAFAGEAEFQTMQQARSAYDSGDWDKAVTMYKGVYEGVEDNDPLKAEAALEWSNILWERGEYKRAKQLAEEALELARKFKLDAAVGRLLVNIGHIEASQGQFSRARKTFQLCASMSNENQDPVFGAVCRMNLSLLDRLGGRPGQSNAELQRDIKLLEGANSPLAAGSALARTADFYARNKDYASALMMLQKAQSQFSSAGSVPAQARNRIRMAQVLQDSGDYDGAKKQLELATGALQKMNNRPALVNAYGLFGRDAQHRGQRGEAVGYYNKSLKLSQGIGNPQLIAQSSLALCEVLANPTPLDGVDHHCAQADQRFGKLGVPELQVRAKIVRGNLAQARGSLQEARGHYKEVLVLMDKISPSVRDEPTVAVQYANLCQIERELNITGTLKTCKAGLEKLKALGNSAAYTEHIAATYYAAGFAAQSEERLKESLRYFEQASLAYMKLDNPEPVRAADARLRMGIIYSAVLKGEDNAEKAMREGIDLLQGQDTRPNAVLVRTQLHQQLVQLLADQKQWEKVRVESNALVDYAAKHNNRASQGWAYNYMAQALLKSGDKAGAIKALEDGVAILDGVAGEKEQRQMMQSSLKSLKK